MDIVQDAWNTNITGNAMWKLHQKLKITNRRLSEWSRSVIGNVYEHVKE